MRRTGKVFAYLSKAPEGSDHKHNVTTWSGGVLSADVAIQGKAKGAFGSGCRDVGFYIRFRFEGEVWAGYCRGEGMYLRARRTKLKYL
jgi:hypothetical protein